MAKKSTVISAEVGVAEALPKRIPLTLFIGGPLVADQEKVQVGRPLVECAKVVAEALGEERGDKVIVFKYKPKVRYRRKKGHRQLYTRLAIKEIMLEKGTKRRSRKSEAKQDGT